MPSPEPPSNSSALAAASPKNRADDLIARSTLAELLTSAASLRKRRDACRTAQNMSVHRCYSQLAEAAEASSSVASMSSPSEPVPTETQQGLSAARAVASDASAVDALLAPARERFDSLEDARKVSLLLQAAELLANDIPADYQALVELCLDPDGARARLHTTAMRCAALRPLFRRAAEDSPEFARAQDRVEDSCLAVRLDLEEKVSSGSGAVEGMTMYDIVRIRMLLGDSSSSAKDAFLRASELSCTALIPSSAAIDMASSSALSLASLHLDFAVKSIFPALLSACNTFHDVFVTAGTDAATKASPATSVVRDDAVLEEFTTWLAEIVEVSIADRVRKSLNDFRPPETRLPYIAEQFGSIESIGSPLGSSVGKGISNDEDSIAAQLGSAVDVQRFSEHLDDLRSVAAEAAAGSSFATNLRLDELFVQVCNELGQTAVHVILDQTQHEVASRTRSILARDYSASNAGRISADVGGLVRLIQGCQETANSSLSALGHGKEDFVKYAVGYVLQRIDTYENVDTEAYRAMDESGTEGDPLNPPKGASSRVLLTSAAVVEALSQCVDSGQDSLAINMRQTRAQLLHIFCLRLSEEVTKVLSSALPNRTSRSPGVSEAGCRAIALLEQARRDATAVLGSGADVDVNFGTEEEILDEGGIVQRVARGWVCCIRDETMTSVDDVHAIQVDSSALDMAMGTKGVFSIATRAAIERCVATNVELFPPGEVSGRIAKTAALS